MERRCAWEPEQTDATASLGTGAMRSGAWFDPSGTTPRRSPRVADASGAIGAQVWIDVPVEEEGFAGAGTRGHLREAVDALIAALRARCPRMHEDVEHQLQAWQGTVTGSADVDALRVRCYADPNVVVVEHTHLQRLRDGSWAPPSHSLRVVVGPDRYGIRVEQRKRRRLRGVMALPNELIEVRIGISIHELRDSCDLLDDDIAELDMDVSRALIRSSAEDVGPLLARRQELLERRMELARRRRALRKAYDELRSGWRTKAFSLDEGELADLERLGDVLEGLRTQLVEMPQLLLSVEGWRQAKRTESLSLAAAALVPPALVAGVLGANVLPWAPTDDWRATAGMLVLMGASAVLAVSLVKWKVFGGEGDGGRSLADGDAQPAMSSRRWWLGLAIALLLVAGLCLLLAGTTTTRATG